MHFRDYYIGHGQERVVFGKIEAEKDLGVIVGNCHKSCR